MEYRPLADFVELSQGLAVNKGTAHLFSDIKNCEFPYPLLRIVDFEAGIHDNYTKYVSKDISPSVIIDEDTIVFTRVTCQCFRGFKGVLHNNLFVVNLISDEITKDYLFTVLQSEFVRKQALYFAQSSVVPDLNHKMFKEIRIPVPNKSTQERISELYLNITNKIENNAKINHELETMARTIYDYWFLQFDFPNEKGKPYKSSGGKMVWNEELKREIPEGWKASDLSPYIEVIRGVAYDVEDIVYEATEKYVPLLKSNNLQDDRLVLGDIIYVNEKKVSDNQFLEDNSIFVTMSSGSIEHVGKTAIIFYDMPYTYGAFCSKIAIKPKYRGYISLFFTGKYFKKKIRTIVVGTSIKNINNVHLTDNAIVIPDENILQKFEATVRPCFAKQAEIIKENQELTSLRDFLLPLLMNGQVGFREC